jgi:hypothetical protein
MNPLDRLKQLASLHVKMELELPQKFVMPGAPIRFMISLEADQKTEVRRLIADVRRGRLTDVGEGEERGDLRQEMTIDEHVVIDPATPYYKSASLELPGDIFSRGHSPDGANYWSLYVTADIPNARDVMQCVEVVIAQSCQFEWHTDSPIQIKTSAGKSSVSARGSYVFAKPDDVSPDVVHSTLAPAICQALTEVLTEQPQLVAEEPVSQAAQAEIAGALRELMIPYVRELEHTSLDNLADLTLDHIYVEKG